MRRAEDCMHAIANEIDMQNLQSVNRIPGIHDNGTPTQYVVNTLYWPHTALSVYLVCYFLVPHTHVLCMGSGSATGKKKSGEIGAFFTEIFFFISVVILN